MQIDEKNPMIVAPCGINCSLCIWLQMRLYSANKVDWLSSEVDCGRRSNVLRRSVLILDEPHG